MTSHLPFNLTVVSTAELRSLLHMNTKRCSPSSRISKKKILLVSWVQGVVPFQTCSFHRY